VLESFIDILQFHVLIYLFDYIDCIHKRIKFHFISHSSTVTLLSVQCENLHQLNKTTVSVSSFPTYTILHIQHTAHCEQSIVVCTAEGVNCVEEHI
jgi:hypothetical protein